MHLYMWERLKGVHVSVLTTILAAAAGVVMINSASDWLPYAIGALFISFDSGIFIRRNSS